MRTSGNANGTDLLRHVQDQRNEHHKQGCAPWGSLQGRFLTSGYNETVSTRASRERTVPSEDLRGQTADPGFDCFANSPGGILLHSCASKAGRIGAPFWQPGFCASRRGASEQQNRGDWTCGRFRMWEINLHASHDFHFRRRSEATQGRKPRLQLPDF